MASLVNLDVKALSQSLRENGTLQLKQNGFVITRHVTYGYALIAPDGEHVYYHRSTSVIIKKLVEFENRAFTFQQFG